MTNTWTPCSDCSASYTQPIPIRDALHIAYALTGATLAGLEALESSYAKELASDLQAARRVMHLAIVTGSDA